MDSLIHTGQPAPIFTLPALDGSLHRLEEGRGRIIVLNFWSAECPWAERGDRELLGYLPAWGQRAALWTIASNAHETPELMIQAAAQRCLPIVLHDADQRVADLYEAQTTPHFFVIDTDGILRYQGALNNVTFRQRNATRFYLRDAVEALLSGTLPDPAQTAPYGCTIVRHVD
ncbi:MAG: redoxin domain-containing protein [Anaerolineales bacterium]|nr:redoxin domain-containing protein [Anaerolineales bacterium]